MEIKLTADWILKKMFQIGSTDDWNFSIGTTDQTGHALIELALSELGIDTEEAYYEYEDAGGIVTGFTFDLRLIKDKCPEFYKQHEQLVLDNIEWKKNKKPPENYS